MGKPNFQRTTIARINAAAPQLKFVAFYHADEDRIKACMNGYKHRSFVYILSVDHEDSEVYLYAGKSKSQYSRFISHLAKFAFDHIYLFECLPGFTDSPSLLPFTLSWSRRPWKRDAAEYLHKMCGKASCDSSTQLRSY